MENTLVLDFFCDPESATIWWEKPDQARLGWRYEIWQDSACRAQTTVTHCTLSNLQQGSSYTITVNAVDDCGVVQCSGRVVFTARCSGPTLDVTASPYGAKGDGITLNTAALQKALDDCPAGGTVRFLPGTYLTGGLRLHSNMELLLEEGAVLQGSADPMDYLPRIPSRFEGIEGMCYQSLLNAGSLNHASGPNCRDIIIRGKGTIRGGGQPLALATIASERERLKKYLAENAALVATCQNQNTIPGRARGRLINLSNCENIRISGLTLGYGASWNVHMVYCRNIVTANCAFQSTGVWNGDGWDPDSSEHCTLFGCTFHTGDDAVAIKSGKNPEGNRIARPTKHIRIFDCRTTMGHGIVIGSEMSGGVEDVQIWDCNLELSMVGIQVKATPKRGGWVRDLWVRDCIVPSLRVERVSYNDDGVPAPSAPALERFTYQRIQITGKSLNQGVWSNCSALEFHGFRKEAPIRGVRLEDITLLEGHDALVQFDNVEEIALLREGQRILSLM